MPEHGQCRELDRPSAVLVLQETRTGGLIMETKKENPVLDITLGILVFIAAIVYGLLMKYYGGY